MAQVVLGIGMSHSSMVANPDADAWLAHAAADHELAYLRDQDGRSITFADLERLNGPKYEAESRGEHVARQAARTQEALRHLRAEVAAHGIQALVVLGDDQMELHALDNMPALGVYYGNELVMGTRVRFASYGTESPDVRSKLRGFAMDAAHRFPGHEPLARHLIGSLLDQGFDATAINGVADTTGQAGIGHAFGIVETTLMEPGAIPVVPIFVNTYWEPNQLPVSRCDALGAALRAAIDAFPEPLAVGIVASGGLSHFVTDEELDRSVLAACRAGDRGALRSLSPHRLNGGNSEIRNWIALAAACEDMPVTWDDYIPVYRTPAGTGVGLAFAVWSSSAERPAA